jgi:hypothetical protein
MPVLYIYNVSVVCPVCKTHDQIYNFPLSYEMVKFCYQVQVFNARKPLYKKLKVTIFGIEDEYECA